MIRRAPWRIFIMNAQSRLLAKSKRRRFLLHCCIRWMGKKVDGLFLFVCFFIFVCLVFFGRLGGPNFGSHCLIESSLSPQRCWIRKGVYFFHSSFSTSQISFLCHVLFMLWVCVVFLCRWLGGRGGCR